MALNLENLEAFYFTWDIPVELYGLKIKPIKMKDYVQFIHQHNCLTIDKNEIGDARIISMTYLDFLCFDFMQGNKKNFVNLISIIELVTDARFENKEIELMKTENSCYLRIFDIKIKPKQFDDLRKLIMIQNIPTFDDSYINPDLKKDLEEYHRLKNKDIEFPTLEKQILCMVTFGHTLQELQEMSIRKFQLLFETYKEKADYEMYKTAELGGMVKFKEDIEHWIYKKKKDKLSGAIINYEAFKDTLSSVIG